MAILDQYGNAVSYARQPFLEAADRSNDRPQQRVQTESFSKVISTTDWRTVLSASRKLYANMGIARGAIDQKADFVTGNSWQPVFIGADKEWGDTATDWLLSEWFPVCEIRGGAFDFVTTLNVDSVAMDRDGGFGVLLTETEDGYPMTQRIPIHRFGANAYQRDGILEDGPYKGLRICQGIISNAQGRPVAARIFEDNTEAFRADSKYQDVSFRDLIHVYDPKWHDQGHGLPAFTHALNDLRDSQQSQKWEQMAMLISSSIGLIERSETGTADPSDPSFLGDTGQVSATGLQTQTLEGGLIRHFKTDGSGLEAFVNPRPGADWESFNDRLIRAALFGIQWPYSMAWKAEGGGTDTRSDIMQARNSVAKRQSVLKPMARRIVGYAVSKAMNLGILPPYRGADKGGFFKWNFQMPPKISIDDGRMAQSKREDYKLGFESLESIESESGRSWRAMRSQREAETIDLLSRAKNIAETCDVNEGLALMLLQQNTPNQIPMAENDPASALPDASAAEADDDE